ncbi:transposase [Cereibacter johrii]|uniref:transposase n=1 Tax=Cereibacter johrii TaxID=445629 RepID=UPI002B260351|nr:transposase [Cereibacter johrii]MEA5163245.1 transposase [Cereibacter johrii]
MPKQTRVGRPSQRFIKRLFRNCSRDIGPPDDGHLKAKACDPEMSSTRMGKVWYFGMKAHIGADAGSGVTHRLETSPAKLHDSQVWDELLHGEETSVWADKGYVSVEREATLKVPGKAWSVMRKAPKGGELHPVDVQINRVIVRADVEHPFRVIKRQFGIVKCSYRGIAENRAQLFTPFALGTLFLTRRRDGMRTSLPDNRQTAAPASLKRQFR